MKQRGMTLFELVIVMVILAMLTSLLFPVFVKAKKAALVTKSASNLHQIHIALSIYRTDYDGDGVLGTASSMGLPSLETLWFSALPQLQLPDEIFLSPCGQHPDGPSGVINYGYYPSDDPLDPWAVDAVELGENIILLDDFNCNDASLNLHNRFRTKFALGVTLSGSIRRKSSKAGASNAFWHD